MSVCISAHASQSKSFEKAGLPRDTAEKLAKDITTLIVLNKEKMEGTFVKTVVLEKVRERLALSNCIQGVVGEQEESPRLRSSHPPWLSLQSTSADHPGAGV